MSKKEATVTGMLQCNTLARKVNFMAPDRIELNCVGNGDGGDCIEPSLFGMCMPLLPFSLQPAHVLLAPLCSHYQTWRRTSCKLVFCEIPHTFLKLNLLIKFE